MKVFSLSLTTFMLVTLLVSPSFALQPRLFRNSVLARSVENQTQAQVVVESPSAELSQELRISIDGAEALKAEIENLKAQSESYLDTAEDLDKQIDELDDAHVEDLKENLVDDEEELNDLQEDRDKEEEDRAEKREEEEEDRQKEEDKRKEEEEDDREDEEEEMRKRQEEEEDDREDEEEEREKDREDEKDREEDDEDDEEEIVETKVYDVKDEEILGGLPALDTEYGPQGSKSNSVDYTTTTNIGTELVPATTKFSTQLETWGRILRTLPNYVIEKIQDLTETAQNYIENSKEGSEEYPVELQSQIDEVLKEVNNLPSQDYQTTGEIPPEVQKNVDSILEQINSFNSKQKNSDEYSRILTNLMLSNFLNQVGETVKKTRSSLRKMRKELRDDVGDITQQVQDKIRDLPETKTNTTSQVLPVVGVTTEIKPAEIKSSSGEEGEVNKIDDKEKEEVKELPITITKATWGDIQAESQKKADEINRDLKEDIRNSLKSKDIKPGAKVLDQIILKSSQIPPDDKYSARSVIEQVLYESGFKFEKDDVKGAADKIIDSQKKLRDELEKILEDRLKDEGNSPTENQIYTFAEQLKTKINFSPKNTQSQTDSELVFDQGLKKTITTTTGEVRLDIDQKEVRDLEKDINKKLEDKKKSLNDDLKSKLGEINDDVLIKIIDETSQIAITSESEAQQKLAQILKENGVDLDKDAIKDAAKVLADNQKELAKDLKKKIEDKMSDEQKSEIDAQNISQQIIEGKSKIIASSQPELESEASTKVEVSGQSKPVPKETSQPVRKDTKIVVETTPKSKIAYRKGFRPNGVELEPKDLLASALSKSKEPTDDIKSLLEKVAAPTQSDEDEILRKVKEYLDAQATAPKEEHKVNLTLDSITLPVGTDPTRVQIQDFIKTSQASAYLYLVNVVQAYFGQEIGSTTQTLKKESLDSIHQSMLYQIETEQLRIAGFFKSRENLEKLCSKDLEINPLSNLNLELERSFNKFTSSSRDMYYNYVMNPLQRLKEPNQRVIEVEAQDFLYVVNQSQPKAVQQALLIFENLYTVLTPNDIIKAYCKERN